MARYMVEYTQKYTGKLCQCDLHYNYKDAVHEAIYVLGLDVAKSIVIVRDSEGEDHIENAGKFFLWRIVK